jgi:hypothetical protein
MLRLVSLATVASLLGVAGVASAQYEDEETAQTAPQATDDEVPPDSGSGMAAPSPSGDTSLGDDQALMEERVGVETARDSTDPYEDPHEGYYFVGAFFRHIFVPDFILKLFTDEAPGSNNTGAGIQLTYRKDNFDIVGSLWFAEWSINGPFRGSGDPDTDTEWIDSNLWTVMINATFLWSTPFNDIFALEYGVGLGVGLVIGDLHRTEAYPSAGPDDPNVPRRGGYSPCSGPGDPAGGFYCEPGSGTRANPAESCGDGTGHYCKEQQWSGGGDVPNVVPWLAIPHLALRIKPIKQLMMRVEGGFGLGFFVGASAEYGF